MSETGRRYCGTGSAPSFFLTPPVFRQKVITVENLTAFYRFEEEDSLMIYLGDLVLPPKWSFFENLRKSVMILSFYHFGDIDAGGIRIFLDLRRRTGIDFHPMHMGVQELKRYEKHARDLTARDRAKHFRYCKKRLKQNQKQEAFAKQIFIHCERRLRKCRAQEKKLEQEIVVYQEAKMNLEKNPDKLQKNRQTSSEIGIKD